MAKIIKSNGEVEERELNGELKELQEIVGGYIQIVPINYQGYAGIVCNENGKLEDLPTNHIATGLVGSQLFPFDYLVGTVILFKDGEIK